MVPSQPDAPRGTQRLTPNLSFTPAARWQASAQVVLEAPAVLSDGEGGAPLPDLLSMFEAAGPGVELQVQSPPAAVLGDEPEQQGEVAFQPDEPAAYVLLQTIETDAGTIYDVTLPRQTVTGAGPLVLSDERSPLLHFPVNPVTLGAASAGPGGGVLGLDSIIGTITGGAVGDFIRKRLLRVIKAPLTRAIASGIKSAEGEPQVLAVRNTGTPGQSFQPVEGAEAWRALLPGGAEQRVLLFIHGFATNAEHSRAELLLPPLASGYQAVLAYNHPTVSRDPLQNAVDLIERIPEDLRLSVDVVAHSRGGLVARSLVELVAPVERFNPRVLLTVGTPHQGTELANPEKWDRLVSLSMTAISWLAAFAGFATPIPKIIEWVLRSAAEVTFALPGIAAMTPGNQEFLARLNTAADPQSGAGALQQRVRYAAVTSRFSIFNVAHPTFRQAFEAIAAQTFIGKPNDLVVPTESMGTLDPTSSLAPDRRYLADVTHWGYFQDPSVMDFVRQQLA
jgi:pimeloyl-ACP methyl ester carboxylesterase